MQSTNVIITDARQKLFTPSRLPELFSSPLDLLRKLKCYKYRCSVTSFKRVEMQFYRKSIQLVLIFLILAIQQTFSLKSYLLCKGNGKFLTYYSAPNILAPIGVISNSSMF